MIGRSEQQRLLDAYREPVNARAALATAAAGLLVIVGLALFGATFYESKSTAAVSSQQAASRR